MIRASGRLICGDAQERDTVLAHLPAHVAASRAEPGCLSFDIIQTSDPLTFDVSETFADRAALDLHTARTRASDWWRATAHVRRDISVDPG